MNIHESNGIISRRWPIIIKNYWFGQRPQKHALPDIARLHSIPVPLNGAINFESWTLLIDLTGSESDLISHLKRDTRKQLSRAEREGIFVERYDGRYENILNDFNIFYRNLPESKSDVRDVLKTSVQLHMLKRLAEAGMLEISRAVGRGGEPLVYRVLILAGDRVRGLHAVTRFCKGHSSECRHYLGRANRYLLFQNMLHYKHQGYSQYDMGGWYSGTENVSLLRVNQFKQGFGGKVICEYDALYGCTIPGRCLLPFRFCYRKIRDSVFRMTTYTMKKKWDMLGDLSNNEK